MGRIQAVFFDMDGTLVHMPITVVEFLSKAYRKLGLNLSTERIAEVGEREEKWFNERYSDYTLRTREVFIEYNHRLLQGLGVEGNLDQLSEGMQCHWENLAEEANEEIYPEVRDVLRALKKRGIDLGVLSGRTLITTKKSLEKHSIRDYFRCVISPQIADAPKGKKSPEMWQFALRQIGTEPDEVLHVDNDYETGIVGAREAGIRAVLIDGTGMSAPTVDCIVINNLAEVLELL